MSLPIHTGVRSTSCMSGPPHRRGYHVGELNLPCLGENVVEGERLGVQHTIYVFTFLRFLNRKNRKINK